MANLFKFAENILNNLDQTTQSSLKGNELSKSASGSNLNTNTNHSRNSSTSNLSDITHNSLKYTPKSRQGRF